MYYLLSTGPTYLYILRSAEEYNRLSEQEKQYYQLK